MGSFCTLRTQRRGFAIFIGISLTLVIILIGVFLIEKLVPVSRDVKGIENGNVAYYQASSALELGLASLSASQPGVWTGGTLGTLQTSGYSLSSVAAGTVVPEAGYGNSEFDSNWNVIGAGRPLQLKLPVNFNPAQIAFEFRVPDLNRNGISGESGSADFSTEGLAGGTVGVINWMLVGSGTSLTSGSTQLISADNVNATTDVTISGRTGTDLNNATMSAATFASTECASPIRCTLKLSLSRTIQSKNGASVPYLEYRIRSSGPSIPQQWTTLSADGYSRGFKQSRTKSVEQTTIGEALDFTVFQ